MPPLSPLLFFLLSSLTMNATKEAPETLDFASTQFEISLIQASPPTNEAMVRNLSEIGEEAPRFGGFGRRFESRHRLKQGHAM